jgi:ADP-ribose pyrophosphatase
LIHEGRIVRLRRSRYRRADGSVVEREVIEHPGAVVIVPVKDDRVLMVRQPREAVEERLLELPAGKLDVEGEEPLGCARRELAEEVGHDASTWRSLGSFWMSPGILTELMHCFMATDLRELAPEERPEGPAEDELIEVVAWPLADLDGLLAQVRDAKSLVGLLRLGRELGI